MFLDCFGCFCHLLLALQLFGFLFWRFQSVYDNGLCNYSWESFCTHITWSPMGIGFKEWRSLFQASVSNYHWENIKPCCQWCGNIMPKQNTLSIFPLDYLTHISHCIPRYFKNSKLPMCKKTSICVSQTSIPCSTYELNMF